MKFKLILMLMTCFSLTLVAQNKTVPAPETLNEIHCFKKQLNTTQVLERGKASMQTKAKAMGLGGVFTNYVMDGDQSTIRITQNDSLSFIVSMASGTGEPSAWYSLFKANAKKGKRSASYVSSNVFTAKSKAGEGIIVFTVKHLGNNVYEIIPSEKLTAGEYFFVNKGTLGTYGGQAADAFAFGID